MMTTQYSIDWLTEKFDSGATLKYVFFWGHTNKNNESVGKFCFSQWYKCPFTVGNTTYKTAEHWMMAQKALLFGDKKQFEHIINCEKPGEAKDFGRQVSGYDDQTWNEWKYKIVQLGNIHKFNQHPQYADFLLKTGDSIIVEASPVDTIWGIGLPPDSADIDNIYAWRGQNLLGFALMEVRDFFKKFGHFQPLNNAVEAPWTKFPSVSPYDMFWRMGLGETYMIHFSKYFDSLTDREKMIYQLTNPAPYDWANYYV